MIYQYQILTPFDPDKYEYIPWWQTLLPLLPLCIFALLLSSVSTKPLEFPNHFICYSISESGLNVVNAELLPLIDNFSTVSVCVPQFPSIHEEYAVVIVWNTGEHPLFLAVFMLEREVHHVRH